MASYYPRERAAERLYGRVEKAEAEAARFRVALGRIVEISEPDSEINNIAQTALEPTSNQSEASTI